MKKLLVAAMLASGMSAAALAADDIDPAQMREQMRVQCAEMVNGVPAEHQAEAEKNCQCVVDNTDYEAVQAAIRADDNARLEALQKEVVAACTP